MSEPVDGMKKAEYLAPVEAVGRVEPGRVAETFLEPVQVAIAAAVAHEAHYPNLAIECNRGACLAISDWFVGAGFADGSMQVGRVPVGEVPELAPMSWRLVDVDLAKRIVVEAAQLPGGVSMLNGRKCCTLTAQSVVARWAPQMVRHGTKKLKGTYKIEQTFNFNDADLDRVTRAFRKSLERASATVKDPATVAAVLLTKLTRPNLAPDSFAEASEFLSKTVGRRPVDGWTSDELHRRHREATELIYRVLDGWGIGRDKAVTDLAKLPPHYEHQGPQLIIRLGLRGVAHDLHSPLSYDPREEDRWQLELALMIARACLHHYLPSSEPLPRG